MASDDYRLDSIERTQNNLTRQRRENQAQRRKLAILIGFLCVAFAVLAAPSILSHSPAGRSMLAKAAKDFGFDATAKTLRIGWVTPLRITGLEAKGLATGSQIRVAQIDAEVTVLDVLKGISRDFGNVSLRGVEIQCEINDGSSSLESDLKAFLEVPSDEHSSDSPMQGHVIVNDLALSVKDEPTNETWRLVQANSAIDILPLETKASFSGVVSEPRGTEGSLQGSIVISNQPASLQGKTGGSQAGPPKYQVQLTCDSLPLSVVTLLRRRMPDLHGAIPAHVLGDATGDIHLVGTSRGTIDADVQQFQIRNLVASSSGTNKGQNWNNHLASFNGRLLIDDRHLMGQALHATTDFASFQLDGALPRSMTLVGSGDNPIQWIDALEGSARAEFDLAAFDRSMPGVIPLRKNAELVSGRAVAILESMPGDNRRRRRVTIQSSEVRARSGGRPVILEPVDFAAIVESPNGNVEAEKFQFKSAFASAVGNGSLQSGQADFEVDFGHLSQMLRPIIDISKSDLAGIARGNLRWNASQNDVWRLTGTSNADNLLVVLPSGDRIRQSDLTINIDAVGVWKNNRLQSLDNATARLASTTMQFDAELVQAIGQPNSLTSFPIRVQGRGNLRQFADTFAPWLPADVHDVAGDFSMNARGNVGASSMRLTSTAIELVQPRIAYQDRYFSQPTLKAHFNGQLDPITLDIDCQSFTIAGDAVSAAIQGEWTAERKDVEIAWRAMLERIQGSVKRRVAAQPDRGGASVIQVGYQSRKKVKTDDWLVMGDCEGRFIVSGDSKNLHIDTEFKGSSLAVVQPPDASANSLMTGPIPQSSRHSSSLERGDARVVWAEPSLEINGILGYALSSGTWSTDSLKIASDWFATSLSGRVLWDGKENDIRLKGPARIKMDEVASRLTTLAGTPIDAVGVHETPIDLHVVQAGDSEVVFTVDASLGWELAEIAGVRLGESNVPVRLTETSVYISPATVPVGHGHLNLAGAVHYRPGPLWMQVTPGRVAQSIELSREMTSRWLKYLTPLAADAATVEGTLGADIEEAIIVFDAPEQSRVVGRLNIDRVEIGSGPMSNQLLSGLGQLRALSRATDPRAPQSSESTLIRMRPQSVDFSLDRGVVAHRRMFFEVDRADVVTSGTVTLDGKLDLIAQLPLDARWLGADLQGLAGQVVTLPIDGTLSRPSLDSSGVRRVVTQLGVQAVQESAENYLQKQLGRGIGKLFGR